MCGCVLVGGYFFVYFGFVVSPYTFLCLDDISLETPYHTVCLFFVAVSN